MDHHDVELLIGLLAAIAVLAEVARRLGVPYPIVLVLGGLVLGFVPGLAAPQLDPDVVFFLFLPPLLYSEAYLASTQALRRVAGEITLLAVGLVVATIVAVAVVAHEVAGMSWAAAFVLGAVVGPTDPVAATSVIRRLGVPERVATIIEGEALVNDGTALAAYKLAIAGFAAGGLSAGGAIAEFVWISVGGVLTGVVVAWLAGWLRRLLTVTEVEVTVSLLMPLVAYVPAERIGVSGVLAAVTAGLMLGREKHVLSGGTRLRRLIFWEVLVFLLNSTLFLLIGLSFPDILDSLGGIPAPDLALHGLVLAATVMGLRLVWTALLPTLSSVGGADAPHWGSRRELTVLGWSGMRGGVSLAAALAVPASVGGQPFPDRDEIIFFAYIVVLATLVLPGLTLGPVIEWLGVGTGEAGAQRDARARAHMLHAAIEHIEELAQNDELPEEIIARLRSLYERRLELLEPLLGSDTFEDGDRMPDMLAARRGAVAAQRAALAELRADGAIGVAAAAEVERELDLEEARAR